MISSSAVETEELNKKVDKVEKPENAADIIKQYEEILCTKRKCLISTAYHQGNVFSRFRQKKKFTNFFLLFFFLFFFLFSSLSMCPFSSVFAANLCLGKIQINSIV